MMMRFNKMKLYLVAVKTKSGKAEIFSFRSKKNRDDYASLCRDNGFDVVVSVNSATPKKCKKVSPKKKLSSI